MNPFEQVDVVHFVDVGCSGGLEKKWQPLAPYLSYVGFDPDAEECERLNQRHHGFRAARHLPVALAGETGTHTLYQTESRFCCSLLKPNRALLERFHIAPLVREIGTAAVECVTFDDLVIRDNLRADILKIDAQGMDLAILRAGEKLLAGAFCVELECSFVQLYEDEPTFSEADAFLRSRGFRLFDLQGLNRIGRANELGNYGKHQLLWCQPIWLYDYAEQKRVPSRDGALRALLICKALEAFDFGLELAGWFRDCGAIEPKEQVFLSRPESWTR